MANINELKKKFYYRFFPDYKDFMANTNLDPSKHTALNDALGRQDEKMVESGKDPLVRGKDTGKGSLAYPKIHGHFDDQTLAASVEEFFDIVSTSDGVSQKVSQILTFLEKATGNGSEEEMANLTEDIVIKLIIKHFWEIKGWPNLFSYDMTKCYTQKEFEQGTYDYKTLINGPLTCMLGDSYFYRTFLHICRKMRNENTHGENSLFGLQDGYVLNRFKLFVYVGTVLLLRKELSSPYRFSPRELTIYYDKDGLEVKLFDNDDEIEPIREDGHHAVYNVVWYKDYRVETIASQSKDFNLTWQSQSPSITIKQGDIDVNNNEIQVNTSSGEIHSYAILESVDKGLRALEHIGKSSDEISQKLDALSSIDEFLKAGRNDYTALIEKQGKYIDAINEIVEKFIENKGKNASFDQLDEWLKQQNTKTDVIIQQGKKQNVLQTIILVIAILLLIGMLAVLIWGRANGKSVPNNLSPDQLVSRGDSLLKSGNYEDAGLFYKEALTGYKAIAASDPSACIRLAEMYAGGKGAQSVDSALHFAQLAKTEATGRGHGMYVYLLVLNGLFEDAEKQIPLAVDPNDAYLQLAEACYTIFCHPDIANRQKIEKAFSVIESSDLIEAQLTQAIIYQDGVVHEDSAVTDYDKAQFIIAPDFAKAFKTLGELQPSYPISYMAAGDLAKDFGFFDHAMEYYCMALQCGIEQAAPQVLLMQSICSDPMAAKHKKLIQRARGLANEQVNIAAKTSNSISYRNKGSIKHAIETQEKVIKTIENKETDVFISNLEMNKRHLVELLLLSGDSASEARAVSITADLERSADTTAIQSYLQAICHMLKKDADDSIIDSLICLAADREFLPAIATRLNIKHQNEETAKADVYDWNYSADIPESIYSKSPEIAYLIADMCVRDEAFKKYVSEEDAVNLYIKCLPYTPREYRIQDLIGNFFSKLAHKKNTTSIVEPPVDKFKTLYEQSQIGIRAALSHQQFEMARHFCLYSYLLLESAYSIHGEKIAPMEEFIPVSDGRIDYYLSSGRVIDNFMDYFYYPLSYPTSYYLTK